MLDKVWGLARLLAILLAIVAGFAPNLGFNVALVLVVLGILAGIGAKEENIVQLFLLVLILPIVGGALGTIPQIGTQLNGIATNLQLGVAGAAATVIAIHLFTFAKDYLMGLGGSGSSVAARTA